MSNEERALLRSVILTPEDDAPRLIYADWLDEQGRTERAELIRVQCRFAEIAHPDKPRPLEDSEAGWVEWHTLKHRADLLLRRRRICWGLRLPGEGETVWVRGFPEVISCTEAAWLYAGERVCAKVPVSLVKLLHKHPALDGWRYEPRQWIWCDPSNRTRANWAYCIHQRIFAHLTPSPQAVERDWCLYPTEADALADLSRACIAFGRGEATR